MLSVVGSWLLRCFIPGIKPGKKTAEYIDDIMSRITLPGSFFLAFIAIMPAFAGIFGVKAEFAQFFGGTSLLICGTQDHAGSCIRYNKAWHQKSKIPLKWIEGAGHNSNTDKPELINSLIKEFAAGI